MKKSCIPVLLAFLGLTVSNAENGPIAVEAVISDLPFDYITSVYTNYSGDTLYFHKDKHLYKVDWQGTLLDSADVKYYNALYEEHESYYIDDSYITDSKGKIVGQASRRVTPYSHGLAKIGNTFFFCKHVYDYKLSNIASYSDALFSCEMNGTISKYEVKFMVASNLAFYDRKLLSIKKNSLYLYEISDEDRSDQLPDVAMPVEGYYVSGQDYYSIDAEGLEGVFVFNGQIYTYSNKTRTLYRLSDIRTVIETAEDVEFEDDDEISVADLSGCVVFSGKAALLPDNFPHGVYLVCKSGEWKKVVL